MIQAITGETGFYIGKSKEVFMKIKKLISLVLVFAMSVSLLAGCSSGNKTKTTDKTDNGTTNDTTASNGSSTGDSTGGSTGGAAEGTEVPKPVTLKVLMNGDKPNDWDSILQEFYNRTKDTLNITFDWQWVPTSDYKDKLNVKMTAGEEYDLVFDAPWMNLRTLTEDGAYADLAPYLNNDAYPGLKEAFPESIMKYNKYSDMNSALPLFFTYGNINVVMYRMDWAKELGIGDNGQISSINELESYLKAVQANKQGVIPFVLKNNRGFYHLFDAITSGMSKEHIYQGSLGQDIFFAFKLNDDETEVVATALPGDPQEYWSDFGGVDFWKQKVEKSREWNQYCETDSLNQADPGSVFQIGKAAAHLETIDAFPKFNEMLKNYNPDAELGIFVHEDDARNMVKGAYSAQVTSSNCLAIPANSKKIDRTVAFLNWLFENAENHDLFEYGIEGKNWIAKGDNQYELPEGVTAATNYNPNGWNLTWNPKYYRFSSSYSDYALKYAEFATDLDNYYISNLTGFVFQSDKVKTEIAQAGAILGDVLTPLNHGILDNPYQVLQDTTAQMRSNGVQTAIDEWVRQENEFLNSKK